MRRKYYFSGCGIVDRTGNKVVRAILNRVRRMLDRGLCLAGWRLLRPEQTQEQQLPHLLPLLVYWSFSSGTRLVSFRCFPSPAPRSNRSTCPAQKYVRKFMHSTWKLLLHVIATIKRMWQVHCRQDCVIGDVMLPDNTQELPWTARGKPPAFWYQQLSSVHVSDA